MSLSIYSSWFNVQCMKFAWREALTNWLTFLHGRGQVVIAINTSEDDSPKLVRDWVLNWQLTNPGNGTRIDIVDIAIPYTDPAFDGKGKAAALAKCTEPFAILLDCDERVVPYQFKDWVALSRELERSNYEAFMVPVVDLIGDERHYKAGDQIGTKWYLHRNHPYLTRGVVGFARNADGVTWDTSKSDSCELIAADSGRLAVAAPIMGPFPRQLAISMLESGGIPFVIHLGYLDLEQRLRQSAFWAPVWTARRGGKDPEVAATLEGLQAISRYRHNLPSWKDAS